MFELQFFAGQLHIATNFFHVNPTSMLKGPRWGENDYQYRSSLYGYNCSGLIKPDTLFE